MCSISLAGIGDQIAIAWRAFSKLKQSRPPQYGLGDGRLLILDEPTADLDPLGRRDVRTMISGLKAQGVAVLLNSHLLSEVERVCDSVAIMVRGRILKEDTVDQLVPEGRTLEEVFVELVEATNNGRGGLPGFMAGDGGLA